MKKYFFLLLLLSVIGIADSFSQTSKVIGITRTYQSIDSVNIQGDTLYNIVAKIHLLDTTNIAKISIKVGNSYRGSNIFNGEYNWHTDSLSTPSSMVYTRNRDKLTVTISTQTPGRYYYEANTYNFQNNIGTPYIRQQ